MEEKIRKAGKEELANIFLKAWRPIVELKQISPHNLVETIKYWQSLLPLSERWLKTASLTTGTATREELIRQRILAEKVFSEELEVFWNELKLRARGDGKIPYWDFVGADTYPETLRRAVHDEFSCNLWIRNP